MSKKYKPVFIYHRCICSCVHAYVHLIQYIYEALLVRSRDKRPEVRIRERLRQRERTKVKHTGQRIILQSFWTLLDSFSHIHVFILWKADSWQDSPWLFISMYCCGSKRKWNMSQVFIQLRYPLYLYHQKNFLVNIILHYSMIHSL